MAARKKSLPAAETAPLDFPPSPPPPNLLGPSPKPDKEWPGLFEIYENSDGTRRAVFARRLSECRALLFHKLSSMDVEGLRFMLTLGTLEIFLEVEPQKVPEPVFAPFSGVANLAAIHLAARHNYGLATALRALLMNMHSALCPELKSIQEGPTPQRVKHAEQLAKRIASYLRAIALKGEGAAHGNAAVAEVTFSDGTAATVHVALLTLDVARHLVESNGELPTKAEVREAVEGRFPDATGQSDSAWRNVWKAAGLASLPAAKAWQHEKAKRSRKLPTGRRN